jgi:hypothetical protein
MKLIKLIAPSALIAAIALFAPHADAQTMGEYATTVAGVGSGGGSMGTSIGSAVNSVSSAGSGELGGGSQTWGASSLGASFDERAGAASGSGSGESFESRAGASSSGSTSESRWPASQFTSGDSGTRFGDSSTRFQDQGRFTERTDLAGSADRFPAGALDQNHQGLDSHYSSSSELDNSYSSN